MNPWHKIIELEQELDKLRNQVSELSHDCVSGLLSRATFEEALEHAFSGNRRLNQPSGIIMIDIDHFKRVNDEHGHLIGDGVIFSVAQCIKRYCRGTDTVARYGGEEFVAILVNTDIVGLAIQCERLRAAVEMLDIKGNPKVTISLGFALHSQEDKDGWAVVERADAALMRAKANGRNRVEGAEIGYDEILLVSEIERVAAKDSGSGSR